MLIIHFVKNILHGIFKFRVNVTLIVIEFALYTNISTGVRTILI